MEQLNNGKHQKNDISNDTSKNDSGFVDLSFQNPLLLTNEEEKQSLLELNNRFANYIEHVRKQELANTSFKTLEELTQIPSMQLDNLKLLYESEINSLREALDKQSSDMASITIQNNILIAEKENIHHDLNDRIDQLQKLTASLQISEAENARLKVKVNQLQNNQTSIDNLTEQLKTCQKQLETEVLLRTSSDNACLTYKEKMEFNEAVFKKELGALLTTHKSALKHMTTLKNDIASSRLLEQMEEARAKLEDYLKEFRETVNDDFLDTINKAANSINGQIERRLRQNGVNDEALRNQHKLLAELEKIKASHIKLENQLSDIHTVSEDEINRLRRIVAELSKNKIDDLENTFNELKGLNNSINEKCILDAEITIYRKMLESEESRTDLNSSFRSPDTKRRKTTNETASNVQNRKILKPTRSKKTCTIM